jgi:hypothetical protein
MKAIRFATTQFVMLCGLLLLLNLHAKTTAACALDGPLVF